MYSVLYLTTSCTLIYFQTTAQDIPSTQVSMMHTLNSEEKERYGIGKQQETKPTDVILILSNG